MVAESEKPRADGVVALRELHEQCRVLAREQVKLGYRRPLKNRGVAFDKAAGKRGMIA